MGIIILNYTNSVNARYIQRPKNDENYIISALNLIDRGEVQLSYHADNLPICSSSCFISALFSVGTDR